MKYRIKIITYASGRKTYSAQFKTIIGWKPLEYDGSVDFIGGAYEQDSREQSLKWIDKHFRGYTKKQTIEFEYITKP